MSTLPFLSPPQAFVHIAYILSVVLGVYVLSKCILAGYVLLLCTKKLRKPAAKLFTKMILLNGVEQVPPWVSLWDAMCKVNFSHVWVHELTFSFSVGMKPTVYTQSINLLLEKHITSVCEGENFI